MRGGGSLVWRLLDGQLRGKVLYSYVKYNNMYSIQKVCSIIRACDFLNFIL